MKVGYFSHTSITPSETFIYDLYKGLEHKGLNITYYCGKSSDDGSAITSIVYTGYAEEGLKKSFLAYKIGQVAGRKGFNFKNEVQQYYSYKVLKKSVTSLPDVAYIDYATSATLLVDFLSHNKIPFIVHVHGYDVTSAVNDEVYKEKLKIVFSKATYIIAPSQHLRRMLILLGCPDMKIHVIHYAVNSSKIIPLSWEAKLKNAPSIIFLGRLTPKKNPVALLHAFKIVKDTIKNSRLTIIGDGELRHEARAKVGELNLNSSIEFLGALPREKSFPIMNQHWVYAQHSVISSNGDQEGFPVSLAEAAAHALPIVSTIHSGIPENVIDGETGFLVNEFNFELMAEKLIYLLKNPDIAEKMGAAGRQRIQRICQPEYRINTIAELIEEAYILSKHSDNIDK
ncbi:glycosyltransferase family 4 protein [Pontibacter russatus]|uniref:glycosyltransferase family 4 protein n=1 Tax=Pontibacter russatus TaxID=2694929 RepID=UPI001379FBB2|nr:glycosyltransferase family 4 protein [Pontibacter russatus]